MTSVDLVQCLKDANSRGQLCLTVPWVIEYMSMMDSQVDTVEQYHEVLILLIDIYRFIIIRF